MKVMLTSMADLYPDGYDSFLLSPEYVFRAPMLMFLRDHMCSFTEPCSGHTEAFRWDPRMPVARFGPVVACA